MRPRGDKLMQPEGERPVYAVASSIGVLSVELPEGSILLCRGVWFGQPTMAMSAIGRSIYDAK
jgi:hypothetical protein